MHSFEILPICVRASDAVFAHFLEDKKATNNSMNTMEVTFIP